MAHGQSNEAVARAEFDAGVRASRADRWSDAVQHFRRSFEAEPHPSAGFNLVVALRHLEAKVELVHAAERFLDLADPTEFATERLEVERLRDEAARSLARVSFPDLPDGATVRVDSKEPVAIAPAQHFWLDPGSHELVIESAARGTVRLQLELSAGDKVSPSIAWERPEPAPAEPTPSADPVPSTDTVGAADAPAQTTSIRALQEENALGPDPERRRAAIARGIGWTGITVFGAAAVAAIVTGSRARTITNADPEATGFLGTTLQFRRARAATNVLSLSSAALTTLAVTLARWRPERRWRWFMGIAGAVLAATGAALGLRAAPRLGQTRVTAPHRLVGGLLFAAGAPLLVAPIVQALQGPRSRAGAAGAPGLTFHGTF